MLDGVRAARISYVSLQFTTSRVPHRMLLRSPRHPLLLALLICAAAAGGCTDLPTGPGAFQLEAEGTLWTAVVAPADLPSPGSWLGGVAAGTQVEETVVRVTAMQQASRSLRSGGDAPRADSLVAEAASLALAAGPQPSRPTLIRAILAVDGWQRDVRESVDLERVPELAAAVERVELEREAAAEALSEGRDEEAAVRLTVAAEWARSWSPEGVALRVLDRVEARLGGDADLGDRARHLVHSARHELVAGEPLRAVQRALYALQIADGQALSEPEDDGPARCGEYSC